MTFLPSSYFSGRYLAFPNLMHFPCTTIRWVFSYRERHFGFSVNEKYTLSSALRSPRVPSATRNYFRIVVKRNR